MTARIQPNATPKGKAQEQLAGVKKMLGSTPNIFTTLAHSPAALNYCLSAGAALNNTAISAVLREQLSLTVAGANACDYCASAHTALGKMQKISEAELAQNLHGKSADAKTQAALSFARKIVDFRGHLKDSDLKAIRAAGYNDAEIVEIIAVVGHNIFTNYFNHIAGTVIDFPKVSTTSVNEIA